MFNLQNLYDQSMKFNALAKSIDGTYSPVSNEFYDKLRNQLKLIQDEVDELRESLSYKDNPEILKEVIDVAVTVAGFIGVLRAAGFQVSGGMEDVCDNNLSKILDNQEEAESSVEVFKNQGIETYIEESIYEGEAYYAVRRKGDGKILKPVSYKKVTLEKYVPVIH